MSKRLVLVAGNIGSGKTSLTKRLGERLGWLTAYESVADNPYLPDFYADMHAWSFHLQIYFLGHRARQHIEMASSARPAVIDRSIYEDAFIFARALNALGNLSDRDYQSYLQLFNLVVAQLPTPSLLVLLKAPVPVLVERIRRRARPIENNLSSDYLALLDSFYDDWLSSYDLCPVLTIRSDDLDFVHDPQHLDQVVAWIEDKLTGKEELVLS